MVSIVATATLLAQILLPTASNPWYCNSVQWGWAFLRSKPTGAIWGYLPGVVTILLQPWPLKHPPPPRKALSGCLRTEPKQWLIWPFSKGKSGELLASCEVVKAMAHALLITSANAWYDAGMFTDFWISGLSILVEASWTVNPILSIEWNRELGELYAYY